MIEPTLFAIRSRFWPLIALLLLLASCQQPQGRFSSPGPTVTPGGELVRQATHVTFAQLNADPAAYQERLLRISGAYLTLPPPECQQYRGPRFAWTLADLDPDVTERLRVDVQGLEGIVWLVPEGTPMTIEGFWRLYQGPLGCGKNAPYRAAWYLQAIRILEPNPLPGLAAGSPRLTPDVAGEEETEGEGTPVFTPTPTETGTPTATASPTLTPTATASPDPLATVTATATPTTTPRPGDPTPTLSTTPTSTATVDAAVTPTPTSEIVDPPPTATPGSYPVASPTTPGGYP